MNASLFTIYNPTTKHIAEEKFFEDYIAANRYCKENYSTGYVAKYDPFHFSIKEMLKEGTHPRIKSNQSGRNAVIVTVDGKTALHCGDVTIQELVNIHSSGIEIKRISKVEFINLHNSLVR